MNKFFKVILLMVLVGIAMPSFSQSWWMGTQTGNAVNKEKLVNRLINQVPIPEIRLGQERKMVAWRAVTFDVENKLGYVYVLLAGSGCIGYYTVYGKVASLNSFLSQQQDVYGSGAVVDSFDIDGTTGENVDGVFMRLTTGTYEEFPTNGPLAYMYSDKPISLFKAVPSLNP